MRYIYLLSVIAFLLAGGGELSYCKSRKKAEAAPVEAPAVKKTPYEKFVSKPRLITKTGFMTLYKDGNKILMEIPDSLKGRKVILSTTVTSSSAPNIPVGKELSPNPVYVIGFTDSLALFKAPGEDFVVKDGEPSITDALAKSNAQATLFSFPIKYRNADSTARVVEATKLFNEADSKILDLKNIRYGDASISGFENKKELTSITGTDVFDNSIAVSKCLTYSLTLKGLIGELSEKPTVTLDVAISLTLLPQKEVARRKADSRIGSFTVPYTSYSSSGKIMDEDWAVRWDSSENIKVYVDTLFPVSWRAAIKEGIESWNEAFLAIGRGEVIDVEPYPANFRPTDPLVSKVTVGSAGESAVSAKILTDKTTGEILSCTVSVPGNYLNDVRRSTLVSISDLDERFREYDLPDDAVCEVLRADIMRVFGQCLGLAPNLAGSRAYSPGQLRDPAFTAEHGITASVTDGTLFNILAQPGDGRRGVTIIADRIGAYDRYAINWLYGSFDGDEEAALDSLIRSKEGMEEYVYCPASRSGLKDARALSADLGNDVFEAYEAGMRHLKYAASEADKWFTDEMPQSYTDLFIDFIWLRFNSLSSMLSSNIGAVRFNDVREGNNASKVEPLPASVQKRALKTFLDGFKDMSWFDSNTALIHTGGPNRDVGRFTITNAAQCLNMPALLKAVAMSHGLAGGEYTPGEFLDDVRSEMLSNAAKGRLSPGEESLIGSYILSLISVSDVMKQNYAKATDPSGKKSFTLSVKTVPDVWTSELESLCYISLGKVRRDLEKGAGNCSDDMDKRKFRYLILLADAGLGNE